MELERIRIWSIYSAIGFGLLFIFSFPGWSGYYTCPPGSAVKHDVSTLHTAIKHYHTEYGYYPKVTENGFLGTAAANAKLIEILEGRNEEENPRNIRFIEISKAREWEGRFRSGIDPNTGTWNDRWGNFYRIRIATDSNPLKSPYLDEKTLPEGSILVWSLGKDGVQGTTVKSDDITSWR